jgi:2-C-methyl-D-erythritol 4-phosphate cytidylyltransferase
VGKGIAGEGTAGKKSTAIILAAGSGKRMNSSLPKQYMLLKDKPVLWYSLYAFEQSKLIDEIILVTGKGEVEHCKETCINSWGFRKISKILEGGAERYLSVWQGIKAISASMGHVLIHDAARPLVNAAIIEAVYDAVQEHGACSAGVPAKDTVKITDRDGIARQTPNRDRVWIVQTPQAFDLTLIRDAYEKFMGGLPELIRQGILITDDTMIVERMLNHPVKMVEASYQNIKITSPEDMKIAESFL